MRRIKTPDEIRAEVIFKSNRECVVCDNHKRGVYIHHIDGDNLNNTFENLAFLCFDCYEDASSTDCLKKKLTAKAIVKFRDYKYQVIATERENSLKVFNAPITELTTEDLLTTIKSAVLIIEIEKIKEAYFSCDWDKRSDIISKLHHFSEHTNFRVAVDVFNFLSVVADETRAGMTTDVAISIYSLIVNFFPHSNKKEENDKTIKLANECVNIAFSLVYDSIIYLKNYEIAMYGLTILKYIHKKGKQQNLIQLIDKVNESYKEIEQILQQTKQFEEALQLVKEFKANIEEETLTFSTLSDHLMKRMYTDKQESDANN